MGQSLSVSVPHSFPRTKGFLTACSFVRYIPRVTSPKKKPVGYRRATGPEFVLDAEVVPFPEPKKLGAARIYFPFDVLEVGRSFTTRRSSSTVRKAIRRFRTEGDQGLEFMVEDQPDGKVRCWREK